MLNNDIAYFFELININPDTIKTKNQPIYS